MTNDNEETLMWSRMKEGRQKDRMVSWSCLVISFYAFELNHEQLLQNVVTLYLFLFQFGT